MKAFVLLTLGLAALMLAAVGCDREVTGDVELADNSSSDCFECHSDSDIALTVARIQYDNSGHAAGANTNRNRLYQSFYQGCEKCHTHQGFIAEVTGVPAAGDNFTTITCFTCHEPHSRGDLQVRVTSAVTLQDGTTYDKESSNLCASCHQSRRNVATYVTDPTELSTHFGPHYSTQSDMIMGTNGYEYASFGDYGSSAHRNLPTDGCVGCHQTASVHESVGGHSWNMENEDRGFVNVTGCNADGCHGDVDDFTYRGVQDSVNVLLDSLHTLLQNAGLVDVDGHPLAVTTGIDSAGAVFNFVYVEEDQSHGIHNTDYTIDLLNSSINYMATGTAASPNRETIASHK